MHTSNLTMEMDLDAALNELGMLSTVTDSRKDYLNEQARRRTSSCYNVMQMNPEFVTRLGPVCFPLKPKPQINDDDEAPRSLRAGSAPHLETDDQRVARHKRTKPRFSRPYHIPKHASTGHMRRTTEPNDDNPDTVKMDSAANSLSLDTNPETSPTLHFLTRSKSVDDLSKTGNAIKVMVSAGVTTPHQELEMVSKNLRNLQVSSS
ncbi:uncharacterized protein LOC119724897 [Patiria miniata]|uniref:Uncharacterized protein n=1 Tax=Patiria miniata TaxID=46514 RepID=A0A913ZLZ7_PATMI|nr:uncharacterized protein LOC119724897 [Patiria miniata]